ncbi:phosphonoacetaldehyde hydrolase-like isoform X2 [Babylonia areolata]|uniref:phosphonoacetaldehyde hydrolase-like isoform X2 n=1 Tax=Babylonia areolata TaxID=304850 RepID=UPI003FCF653C
MSPESWRHGIVRNVPACHGVMNHFLYTRRYVGPVKACILDWSGTTVDKYVLAPAAVFLELFKQRKVPISMDEARKPMGIRKDLHIAEIAGMPSVQQRWQDVHGKPPRDEDVQAMFKQFVPTQIAVLKKHGTVLPGTVEGINQLRKELGCRIGITTGFLRSMADVLVAEARKQGFEPDANVARDDVNNGLRPRPFMLYRNLDLLDVHPIQSVVKVDDIAQGMQEAHNAGCWAVGVARYSHYMGIDRLEEEEEITAQDMESRLERSREVLRQAGAHYVIDSVADLPAVVADINCRLARGEKP